MMSLQAGFHYHIVEILGHGSLGQHTASYFIDMEYCDIDLDEYIRGKRPAPPPLLEYDTAVKDGQLPLIICAIIQEILSGLIFIHKQGKVHRDLKPQNSKTTLFPC